MYASLNRDMNRTIQLFDYRLEELTFVNRQMPTPGRRQVLVRIHAASLNSRDLQIVEGRHAALPKLPIVPLSDGAGEIVAIGDDVKSVAVGDRVVGTFWQRWEGGEPEALDRTSSLGSPLDGVLQQYVVLNERGVVKIPEHLSYAEAATLPCAALTAWYSLVTTGRLKAGETVLIHGTGGVSMFALQFTKLFGASGIVTSSSDEKLERAQALGARCTINYRKTPEWNSLVLEATGGRGVDHVIDIGGADTLSRSLRSIAVGGCVNLIGYLGGQQIALDALPILHKAATVRGIPVGSREACMAMMRALDSGKVRPLIDRVFSWDEVDAAFRHFKSGSYMGKVVIEVT